MARDPAKRERRSTHGIQPPTQTGRRQTAAPSAGRAEPALTWNPRRPASAARSPASRPRLSSHFPASRASRLRPRPAPERRPHSAATGWRGSARAGAEAEEAQETERGLLIHCHLGRDAATAWSLRPPLPPPTPARSLPAPPPRVVPPPPVAPA